MQCDRCGDQLSEATVWIDPEGRQYAVMCDGCTLAVSASGKLDMRRCIPASGGDVESVRMVVEDYRRQGFTSGLCPGQGHAEPGSPT